MARKDSQPAQLPSGGLFGEAALRVKLVLRLMADRRVSPFLKAIPVLSVVYLFFPDILIGPFDDMAVIGIASTLFVELCPQEVVEEHMRRLRGQADAGPVESSPAADAYIDGEFYEVSDTSPNNNGRKEEPQRK